MTKKAVTLSTDEFLAQEFVSLRSKHFELLPVRVRKLVLEIVQYYLSTFYTFDDEAGAICRDIETTKNEKNEPLMYEAYKRFLEFLPIRLRSGIQGKNLFKQPTELDLMLSHFCEVDLSGMKAANEEHFKRDESGMSVDDHMKLIEYYLNQQSEQEQDASAKLEL